MDSTLVIGGPDTDINFGVSLAWVHLRRTTVGLEEHHVSDMVLKELESMSKGEDQWGAKMYVFKELVEHHIKDEEKKVFKSAEKAVGHDEIQNIMKQFELAKQKIKMSLK